MGEAFILPLSECLHRSPSRVLRFPLRRVSRTELPATMAAALGRSNTDAPVSSCSIPFLLPRTLESSFPDGGPMSKSNEQEVFGNLFKSAVLKDPKQLVEQAKTIIRSNMLSNAFANLEDGGNIPIKSTTKDQIEWKNRKDRQRRPSLPGSEQGKHVFNFSAKTIASEDSSVETTLGDSQSWPEVDFSCLNRISDPVEFFSTYRMLENAEKEVKRLKGESSLKLGQTLFKKDRQRRPGLLNLQGKENVFNFPVMDVTLEPSQMQTSCHLNGSVSKIFCSEEIRQNENAQVDDPKGKSFGDAKVYDEVVDEFLELMSECRGLDSYDEVADFVRRKTLQCNPINLEKLRISSFCTATQNSSQTCQLNHNSPSIPRSKFNGLSNLKRRLSLISHQGLPLLLPSCAEQYDARGKQSDAFKKLKSISKDPLNVGISTSQYSERGKQICDSQMLISYSKDMTVDGIAQSEQEPLKSKLLNVEKIMNPIDHLSALTNDIPLTGIQDQLAKISTLKRQILEENVFDGDNLLSNNDDSGGSSLSKSNKAHSISTLGNVSILGSCLDSQNASVPVSLDGRKLTMEHEIHSSLVKTSKVDKGIGKEITGLEPDIIQKDDQPLASEDLSLANNCSDVEHQSFDSSETSANAGVYESGNTLEANAAVLQRVVHDEACSGLPTIIGVKKFETPAFRGKKTLMKVKSFISEEYADLVAQAGLH
ncbi:hypothetical protein AXF42_Ash010624 [Apostasia shenzhenica]|uniref:Uncharacterized protein n=1 Tax=Apostasia shenzhenica TaxID=1088818 RepID=A0A2I0A6L4_9ASPA|nr:hypothetical protein AXF42_Ash010624 [Apostasia shenzhenica]